MTSKVDKSLVEVWEMKNRVYLDFKNSGLDNFFDFFEKEMEEIRKKYLIKYYKKELVEEDK